MQNKNDAWKQVLSKLALRCEIRQEVNLNEHFLKEFVRIEREKGREESDANVWSKKEVEERRTLVWTNAYKVMEEIKSKKTPVSASGASGGSRKQHNSPEERLSPPPTPVQVRKRSKKSK